MLLHLKQKMIVAASIVALCLLAAQAHLTLADMAPPPPAAGSDLFPSIGNTNVRMVSEYVLLDIAGLSEYPGGQARVTANFVMKNLGDEPERMQVRFPMNHAEYSLDYELANKAEFCEYIPGPSLDEFMVWVNGTKVVTQTKYETMEDFARSPDENGNQVNITVPCWAYFWVTFPPQEDVDVKISYTVPGYNYQGVGYDGYGGGKIQFTYVLGTGAGWKDSIGEVDIVARLPYDASEWNVAGCEPDDCVLKGKEVSWHYEDLEPEGNVSLQIVRPDLWMRVLNEKENIQKNPKDGEAWGRLGKAYKEALLGAKGMIYMGESNDQALFVLSQEAYRHAVDLLPDDADWHYGFADLLCNRAMWNEGTPEEWAACLEQLKHTLELQSGHEKGNGLLAEISSVPGIVDLNGAQPDYLILTPQLSPTATNTQPSSPTSTNLPETNTPTSVTITASATQATVTLTPATPEVVEITSTTSAGEAGQGEANPQEESDSTWLVWIASGLGLIIMAVLVVRWVRQIASRKG